jgi:hypothetical protein
VLLLPPISTFQRRRLNGLGETTLELRVLCM